MDGWLVNFSHDQREYNTFSDWLVTTPTRRTYNTVAEEHGHKLHQNQNNLFNPGPVTIKSLLIPTLYFCNETIFILVFTDDVFNSTKPVPFQE
jgi:hypothetical protein